MITTKTNSKKRNSDLSSRLKEVLLDGQWIANTNFQAQIESVTWEHATLKVGSLNTIAALTYHVSYYLAGILNVLKGGELEIKDKYSFDLPPIASESDWKALVTAFINNAEEFVAEVAQLSDSMLDETFVDEKYGTYLRNIEGVIEHSYYHLGQVSLIRKLVIENQD